MISVGSGEQVKSDAERFAEARLRVLGELSSDSGFGTLAEKAQHKILKEFIEPDGACHEVKLLGSIVDIKNGEGVFEIQTRGVGRLLPKLQRLLPNTRVTVVYPIPLTTHIRWIDKSTGEITPRRKSPKKGSIYDALWELYNIRELVRDKNLSVMLMLLNVEDYRYRGERVKVAGRYRNNYRMERIPTSLEKIIRLKSPEDYRIFLPEGLGEAFTAADFNRAVGGGFRHGYSGIQLLVCAGLVSPGERSGRRVIYRKLPPAESRIIHGAKREIM